MSGARSKREPSQGWPRITIVTPSFNQVQFLESAILSVLSQGYPNLEYIVMDGGSTDNSVDVIRKHEHRISYWVSEKDEGQADAIHRGFERSSGEILGWVNSDDLLLPDALLKVGWFFRTHPTVEFATGGCVWIDEQGRVLSTGHGLQRYYPPVTQSRRKLLFWGFGHNQPATFWRRSAYLEAGGLDASLSFCFDYDLLLKLAHRKHGAKVPAPLAAYRVHAATKTSTMDATAQRELQTLRTRYGFEDYNRFVRLAGSRWYSWAELWQLRVTRMTQALGVLRIPAKIQGPQS